MLFGSDLSDSHSSLIGEDLYLSTGIVTLHFKSNSFPLPFPCKKRVVVAVSSNKNATRFFRYRFFRRYSSQNL